MFFIRCYKYVKQKLYNMDSWENIKRYQKERVVEIIKENINKDKYFIIEKIRTVLGITYGYAVELYNENS
jgi:hypothetical protein